MRTIKWGILGLGKIAHSFVQDLNLVEDAQLYAVASRTIDKARFFGDEYGAKKFYGSYKSMLKDENVDIVYIASPHSHHYEHILECLNAGKNVLCEKAFTVNAAQAKKVIKKAKEKNLFLMEALWSRFNPTIREAKKAVDQGEIGQIQAVKADFNFVFPYDTSNRLVKKELAGGSLLDIGIYPIFLSYLFFGKPIRMHIDSEYFPNGVDKNLIMLFDYENGEEAILNCGFQYYSPSDAYLLGDEGCIRIHGRWHESDAFTKFTKSYENPSPMEFDIKGKGYTYEIDECHRCLRNNLLESPLWTWQNTIDMMEILDSVRKKINLEYGEIEKL